MLSIVRLGGIVRLDGIVRLGGSQKRRFAAR
jgi:hypothetical protein